jgi:hypothetical protein
VEFLGGGLGGGDPGGGRELADPVADRPLIDAQAVGGLLDALALLADQLGRGGLELVAV